MPVTTSSVVPLWVRFWRSGGSNLTQAAKSSPGDGAAAFELAKTTAFDLLLADVVMPGLDGIELARKVSEQQPGIRIMFITGFAAVVMREESWLSNRPRVLAKPFHLRHLIDEIEALLLE